MAKETDKPKFPKLAKCSYWGLGVCAETGCVALGLMNNSKDLGKVASAKKTREKIENKAKEAGCPVELARPTFKQTP